MRSPPLAPTRAARRSAHALLVGLLGAAGLAAIAGRSVASIVTLEALAFVPYAFLLAHDESPRFRRTLLLAFVAAAPALLAPPWLSGDLFRYLWDGRVLAHGLSPYAKPPDDPSLAFLRDAAFRSINHPGLATIYPPFAEILFALVAPLGVLGPKLLAFVAHLSTARVVAALAPERGRAAAFAYALNPLALVECALSGHIDVIAALLLALAVLAFTRAHLRRATAFAALATATKLVGFLFVPILASRSRRAALVLAALSLSALVPLAHAGGSSDRAGLANFARRWRGNDGAYALVESAYERVLVACCRSAPNRVAIPLAETLVARVAGTPLDPRHELAGPKKEPSERRDFHLTTIVPFLARGTVALVVLVLAFALVRRGVDPVLATRHVILAMLLLSPQVHPWYLLLLLPFEAASHRVAGFVFSAAALVAYAPLDAWNTARVGIDAGVPRFVEHSLVLALVAVEETRAVLGRVESR